MNRTRNKANATGRTPTSRFARLDHRLLESPAYRALSPNARALLIEIVMLHNGLNNGRIFLSRKDAAALIGLADEKATGAAFSELQALGFISMTRDASFRIKAGVGPRSREWRLTFEPVTNRSGPTHDYLTREPAPQTRARKRMETGLKALKARRKAASQIKTPGEDSPFLPPKQALTPLTPGEESTPAKLRNNAKQPKLIGEDSPHHLATSATVRSLRNPNALPDTQALSLAWWQPDGLTPLIASMTVISTMTKPNDQTITQAMAA
jgi:hypothetical protein